MRFGEKFVPQFVALGLDLDLAQAKPPNVSFENQFLTCKGVGMFRQQSILDEMNRFGITFGRWDGTVIDRTIWRDRNECVLIVHRVLRETQVQCALHRTFVRDTVAHKWSKVNQKFVRKRKTSWGG